ncbi:MAG: preprotein translocase subunit SecG, partial [Proteobacteria bacterium]|nr:preprotein translocase subunit SecG [Pseudomonadota bacterium]
MYIFLLVVYAILCLALIGLILLQRGRGSSTGLTYDPQSSVFGSSGSVSFLVKFTAVLAVLFFVLGIVIGINFRDSLQTEEKSLIERTIEDEGQGEQTEGAGEGDALNDIPSAGDIPS